MAGRGSFIESFPLFGYDLDDYDELFAEKLELLLAIRERNARHLVGPAPRAARTTPACGRGPSRIRCPSGSRSAARRSRSSAPATLGLPLTIAIIGGQPERFAPLVDLYRQAFERSGHDPADARSAINTHAFVGRDVARRPTPRSPHSYLQMMNRIGRERGWPPAGREQYEALRSPRGALAVGSPEQVAEKILFEHELFGHERYIGADERRRGRPRRRDALDRAVRDRGRAGRARRGGPA